MKTIIQFVKETKKNIHILYLLDVNIFNMVNLKSARIKNNFNSKLERTISFKTLLKSQNILDWYT